MKGRPPLRRASLDTSPPIDGGEERREFADLGAPNEPKFCEDTPQLPKTQNIGMSHPMEELFGDPAYKGFVLQDRKRLPSRFSARVSGALTSRLR
ncbi:hypothetical protein [Mesorhizobium sp. M7A.F.Ca.US.008.03.1.1]|nr:hypothetical protein [Mesorhizobium sp. M7A.F.Ca.US.008.03.1.1]